jgi:hypothetical protein
MISSVQNFVIRILDTDRFTIVLFQILDIKSNYLPGIVQDQLDKIEAAYFEVSGTISYTYCTITTTYTMRYLMRFEAAVLAMRRGQTLIGFRSVRHHFQNIVTKECSVYCYHEFIQV